MLLILQGEHEYLTGRVGAGTQSNLGGPCRVSWSLGYVSHVGVGDNPFQATYECSKKNRVAVSFTLRQRLRHCRLLHCGKGYHISPGGGAFSNHLTLRCGTRGMLVCHSLCVLYRFNSILLQKASANRSGDNTVLKSVG